VPSPSVEDYIKAIYKAHAQSGSVATQELAERLHVSAPAVSKMMRKLSALKLITHAPYQGVKLTRAGEKLALEIIRHHR
jgi:DtxR family transcriptional regulator, Mn-dependent transcriptional regulator